MIDICAIPLSRGAHGSIEEGCCVMEMSAYVAREKWSDHPACVSPVIAAFCRSWNDALNDDTRQRLKPYAFKVVGTKTTKKNEATRAWLAADWLARVQAPAWLRLAGLEDHARALESLARISDATTARAAQPSLDAAWTAARTAARDAARAAAWEAAGTAAGDAAWAAATKSLAPTVEMLQESAFGLLDAMIAVGQK